MPPPRLGAILHQVGSSPAFSGATDRQLLGRFAHLGDRDAFAQLVKRHGSLVMGVCRRVLGNSHDAEDVFQAVFLVLARRAGAVRWNESIGGWIYEVACRAAFKARATALRRRQKDIRSAHPMKRAESGEKPATTELCSALDEELSRLPEKLRTPLSLVYLDGRSRQQVALELGYSERTLKRRLAEAKLLLRRSLEKRGLTLSAAFLAIGLSASSASARVRAALLLATVKGAVAFSSGKALEQIPIRALDIAGRMLKGVVIRKMQVCLLVTIMLAAASAGAGIWACQLSKDDNGGTGFAAQAAPAKAPSAPSVATRTSHVDRYGDPLPTEAIARLGTVRFRHEGEACSLAYSPDGKTLAAASNDARIFLFDAASGKELRRLPATTATGGYPIQVYSLEFSSDGRLLASRANDSMLRLWDTRTWQQIRSVQVENRVTASAGIPAKIAFSPDNKTIAVPGQEGIGRGFVSFIDLKTGKEAFRLASICSSPFTIAFSADGGMAAIGGARPSCEVWSMPSRKLRYSISGHQDNSLCQAVAFSPDGKMLASGERGFIILSEISSGREVGRLTAAMTDVNFLHFSADGKMLVSAAEQGGIRVWDVTRMKEHLHLQARKGIGRSAALSPDGKTIVAGTAGDTIQLWDLASGRELFVSPESHNDEIESVAFSPDGACIATGSAVRETVLWDVASLRMLRKLNTGASSLAFSPDGRRLATAWVNEPGINVWDANRGTIALKLRDGDTRYESLTYSPDGRALLSWRAWDIKPNRYNASVQVWDTTTVRQSATLPLVADKPYRIGAAAFNGRLAVAAVGTSVRIWDVRVKKEVARFDTAPGWPSFLHFLPDGKTLLAASAWDGSLLFWDMESRRCRLKLSSAGGPSDVMAVSKDGSLIAVVARKPGSQNIELSLPIQVCEVATGKEVLRFGGQGSKVTALAFSPGGKTLISGLRNSTALLWSLVPKQRSKNSVEELWNALAGEDAAEAYRAQWKLASLGRDAVAFVRARVRPAPLPDVQKISGLIAKLESPQFAARDEASRELISLGEQAEPMLLKTLGANPSPDLQQRINACLATPRTLGLELIRTMRAVYALEKIGSPDAEDLLKRLSGGNPEAAQTRQAKAAFDRLTVSKSR